MFGCSRTSDISCSTKVPEAKRAHLKEHFVYVVGLSVAYQEVDYMEDSVGMAYYLSLFGCYITCAIRCSTKAPASTLCSHVEYLRISCLNNVCMLAHRLPVSGTPIEAKASTICYVEAPRV